MSEAPCDLLVVGAGAAGLTAALTAAGQGARVLMLTKGHAPDSSSWHAQGGIAGAVGDDDTAALHAVDTERAGRELCRPSAVKVLTEEGPERVRELIALGVPFDPELSLEGGHSRRRVSSVDGAATGWAVTSLLGRLAARTEGIATREATNALALWIEGGRCRGVVTPDGPIAARSTILAMGGAAALWARSTNPEGQIGDGIAIAFAAGAAVADLEFMQFHPTVLAGSRLLLTEALRGEGATLIDAKGERFVDELAPRDEVARAIVRKGSVWLDLRDIDRSRFPGLMAEIEKAGFDPATEPIPVSPAAHYTIGGVVTDLVGRTDIPGLFAAGESAATGVHGANRLASNSLLECLVFGRRAALAALDEPAAPSRPDALPLAEAPPVVAPTERTASQELREQVWREAGVMRDPADLANLARSPDVVAALVARFALARSESRGVHYRIDAPTADPAFEGHFVLRPGQELTLEHWS
ncbi:MAG: FAD-dependent oxidoreductase [Candidatus Limnocylindrales bacterium]|jgi:L-aspartate oxidase